MSKCLFDKLQYNMHNPDSSCMSSAVKPTAKTASMPRGKIIIIIIIIIIVITN